MPVRQKRIPCTYCPLKLHPKGYGSHLKWHQRQFENPKTPMPPEQPVEVSQREIGYKLGYQEGQNEQRRRMGDARVALVESVAKLNQALAGILDEFRNG